MPVASSVRSQMMKLFRKNKKDKSLVNNSVSASINNTSNYSELSVEQQQQSFNRGTSRRGSKIFRSIRKKFSRSKSALSSSKLKEEKDLEEERGLVGKSRSGGKLKINSSDETGHLSKLVSADSSRNREHGSGCCGEPSVPIGVEMKDLSPVSPAAIVIEPPALDVEYCCGKDSVEVHHQLEKGVGVVIVEDDEGSKLTVLREGSTSEVKRRSYEMSMNRNSELTAPPPVANKTHHRMSYTGGNETAVAKKVADGPSSGGAGRPTSGTSSTMGRPVHRNATAGRRGGGKVSF